MIIGIVVNETKDPNLSFAGEISAWFEARGHTVILDEYDDAYESDFLVVLGGDGTMLRAAKMAAKFKTPMLGINLGNLGYLTDVDRDEGFIAIEKMLAGHFRQEHRMMLECRDELALNEVFLRSKTSKLTSFKIEVGGKRKGHMDTLRADGIIVSTPTGSTAYNLSAGGPILKPDSEMMVVTAVCPHTLYTRPWVLSGEDQVCISPLDEDANAFLDGEQQFTIKKGESLVIGRSEHIATVIKTSSADFFGVLRKKMGNS
jgi:NAD+ kinase